MNDKTNHKHMISRVIGPLPSRGSVAQRPYTDENPQAHGGARYIHVCHCGARREALVNGGHSERSPWRARKYAQDYPALFAAR